MSAHCTSAACTYTLAHTVDWCRPTRPESLEERLARIQATVDGVDPSADFALKRADVRWLLSQVSGERRWQVEAQYSDGWGQWEGSTTYRTIESAREALAEAHVLVAGLRDGDTWKVPLRLVSAPVQVWTPEEES